MPTADPTAPFIEGRCPMGCGRTLFVADGGRITCSYLTCPRPTAVDELLEDRETEHIVEFGEESFTVRHPLRERLDDELMTCALHDFIANLPGPPVRPGRYRATPAQDVSWTWQRLPDTMEGPHPITTAEPETFDQHCVVELLGHRRLPGRIREVQLAGAGFLRLDVPATDGHPEQTQYIAPGSVYAPHATTDAIAAAVAARCRPEPVHRWELSAAPGQPRTDESVYEVNEPDEEYPL